MIDGVTVLKQFMNKRELLNTFRGAFSYCKTYRT